MSNIQDTSQENQFWTKRYNQKQTGWDIGYPSTPIKAYFDQLTDKSLRILIPGAGNAYEAEYLFKAGFKNVHILDIAEPPLTAFKTRVPNFPSEQAIQGNFFEHSKKYQGQYDIIVEQTFFCSFPPLPENRQLYTKTIHQLLAPKGKLIGLWFSFPLKGDLIKRPFGGSKEEYFTYFKPYFEVEIFEPCYNSIPPRAGSEYFGLMAKKDN